MTNGWCEQKSEETSSLKWVDPIGWNTAEGTLCGCIWVWAPAVWAKSAASQNIQFWEGRLICGLWHGQQTCLQSLTTVYAMCVSCREFRVECRVSSVECRGASLSLSFYTRRNYTDVDRGSHYARLAQSRRDICIPNITEIDNLSPVGHPDIKDRGTHTLLSLSPMLFRNRLAANVSHVSCFFCIRK